MHFYDARYPAAATALLRPPDALVGDYREVQRALGLERVVVVQPTTYGLDNSCQLDAAEQFGDGARSIVVVDEHTTEADLARLHESGARGARFHMLPGGAVDWPSLPAVAARIAPLGWHVQLQMNGRELAERAETLNRLACPLVIDHIGRYMPPVDAEDARFVALLRLLDGGRCWVKLSAPYESTLEGAPSYPSVSALVERLVAHAPERMLWATNWPHPGQLDPLDTDDLLRLRQIWLTTSRLERLVLVDNPAELYGLAPTPIANRTEIP